MVAGDSVYSLESLGVGWPPFAEPLRLFDQNGDGQVSLAEAEKDSSWLGSLRGIDLHSGNGDGLVTAEEYARATSLQDGAMYRVRLGGKGDVAATHVIWRQTRGLPLIPSPLVYENLLYTVRRGIVATFNVESGKLLREERLRLRQALGEFDASPVAGDGKIYLVSQEGVVSVLKAGAGWQVLSTADLGERAEATPAIAGGRVYIRSEHTLYCFGKR